MKTSINHVKIFDGEKVLAVDGAVLFDESGILQVGSGAIAAEREIDGTGKVLTPGLMDGHVHLGSTGMNAARDPKDYAESGALTAAQAQELWQYGITTVRNMATGTNADIYVRDMIRAGRIKGCRIIACGKGICITGGHGWPMGLECDTEDEVRKAARLQIREGADMIKLLATGGMATKGSKPNVPQLTEGQMRVAVDEAAKVGLFTAAHCTGLEGAQNAIRAGVRVIEHAQLDRETAEMMAEAGAFYCPTIITRYKILHITDPELMWMRAKADPQDLVRKKRALNLCQELGITICAGTDAGPNPFVPLGTSFWQELGIYQEYGLSPIEVLRSATVNNAVMMQIDKETGRIQKGLAADLALFEQDVTEDVNAVSSVCMTVQGGKIVWHKYR